MPLPARYSTLTAGRTCREARRPATLSSKRGNGCSAMTNCMGGWLGYRPPRSVSAFRRGSRGTTLKPHRMPAVVFTEHAAGEGRWA